MFLGYAYLNYLSSYYYKIIILLALKKGDSSSTVVMESFKFRDLQKQNGRIEE